MQILRRLALVAVLVGATGDVGEADDARAEPSTPLRVAVVCQAEGRTKACPTFLLGIVDAQPVLVNAPRATADIVVYVAANEVVLVDRVHLRFVSRVEGAPPVLEVEADLDTRKDDDTQRAQLEAAFLRGLAPIAGARFPDAVRVTLSAPEGLVITPGDTTPWTFSLSFGGSGNKTERYTSLFGFAELTVSRVTRSSRLEGTLGGSTTVTRQPALVADDGTVLSLDAEQWDIGGGLVGAWLLDDTWSFGGAVRLSRDDPKGQFRYAQSTRVGVEWDLYPAADPRGNRLAVLYAVGYQVEGYNLLNEIGERAAHYPVHQLVASGTVRRDTLSLGLSLSAGSQLDAPWRRYHVTASPFLELRLGGHVDVTLSLSLTMRELPGPDPAVIDPSDYALTSRLSYAEPLALDGSLSVTIHWDRTNAARNDRFSDL